MYRLIYWTAAGRRYAFSELLTQAEAQEKERYINSRGWYGKFEWELVKATGR